MLKTIELYEAVINPDFSVFQLLAMGFYYNIDPNFIRPSSEGELNRGFCRDKKKIQIHSVEFEYCASSKDAGVILGKMDLIPASFQEMLFFGKKTAPRRQENPVVALRSPMVIEGKTHVQCIGMKDSSRDIFVAPWDMIWPAGCHFLAVKK